MIIICFKSTVPTAVAAQAPPAPEPTPEDVIATENISALASARQNAKKKATGLGTYQNDLSIQNTGSGLNVPV